MKEDKTDITIPLDQRKSDRLSGFIKYLAQ